MEEIRFFDGAWVVWDVLAGAPRATQPDDVFAEALPIIVNADTPALTLNGGSGADVYRITSALSAHITIADSDRPLDEFERIEFTSGVPVSGVVMAGDLATGSLVITIDGQYELIVNNLQYVVFVDPAGREFTATDFAAAYETSFPNVAVFEAISDDITIAAASVGTHAPVALSGFVTATDGGSYGVDWSLAQTGDHSLFEIDLISGTLSWIEAPVIDAETPANNVRTVTVIATDGGGLTDSIDVTVTVRKFHPILLTSDSELPAMAENQSLTGFAYIAMTSYLGSSADITYSLVITLDTLEGLTIDPTTGEVWSVYDVALDFETRAEEIFIVRATHISGASNDFTITIPLIDVNEAPVIDDNTPTVLTATVGETALTSITATDPDINELLSWSLTGADADDFTIADGVISWKTPPTPGQPSASGDNIFDITAIVSDDENLQDMIDLSITLM